MANKTIILEKTFSNLILITNSLINLESEYTMISFQLWFNDFFKDVVVFNKIELKSEEFEKLHKIDNLLDYEVEFILKQNRLSLVGIEKLKMIIRC